MAVLPVVDNIESISNLPEVREKITAVKKYIGYICRNRNLFAWREFIHDLEVDTEVWICKLEAENKLSGKVTGIGAYCNMALQGALNYASYYSAKCRRGDYETVSLDKFREDDDYAPKELAISVDDTERVDLLMSVEHYFGEYIRDLAERALDGQQLSSQELARLRTPQFEALLRGEAIDESEYIQFYQPLTPNLYLTIYLRDLTQNQLKMLSEKKRGFLYWNKPSRLIREKFIYKIEACSVKGQVKIISWDAYRQLLETVTRVHVTLPSENKGE